MSGENNVHASVVVLGRYGLLIEGPSGSGKSTLAAALVADWQTRGLFARWVADDQVAISASGLVPIARPFDSIAGQAERAHLGIMAVDHLPSAAIDLVVALKEPDELERLPEPVLDEERAVPLIAVPCKNTALAVSLIRDQLVHISNHAAANPD